MSSSSSKRKSRLVSDKSSASDEKGKPSVFDRLGPGLADAEVSEVA